MLNNWDRYGDKAIPKERLIKGNYYAGICRNANIARWDGEKFIHWREKFSNFFLEDIPYWELDGTFDGFIPIFTIFTIKSVREIDIDDYNAPYHIIVNGKKVDWEFSSISYEDICELTKMDPASTITMTITYIGDDLKGKTFTAGQYVAIRDNCIINAFYTGNS